MTLISSGINKVRAFELPCGIWGDGRYAGLPRVALIAWQSDWSDKLYQVYVNGQYAGTTADTCERKMVVHLPTSFATAARIEVFAVEAVKADKDYSGEICFEDINRGRVRIVLLRNQNLPIGSSVQIYFDNGTGQIDYTRPLNRIPIRLWTCWQDKAGFGMSRFGLSDFGYDLSAAVGFGRGSFGQGMFGADADTLEWISDELPAGIYKFAVKVIDQAGNTSAGSETGEITIIPAARPAGKVNVSTFNKQSNQLVLSIS